MTAWSTLASPARWPTVMRRAAARRSIGDGQRRRTVFAITAGNIAGSSALVGLGLDSIGEVSYSLVILW